MCHLDCHGEQKNILATKIAAPESCQFRRPCAKQKLLLLVVFMVFLRLTWDEYWHGIVLMLHFLNNLSLLPFLFAHIKGDLLNSFKMARKPSNQQQYSRLSPCGHLAITDKSQLHGETHKEMTETNSRYYGLSLLRKCGHFSAPKRVISLVFSLAIADT